MNSDGQSRAGVSDTTWARLVSLIANAAKRNDRVPQWRLECVFQIGDGSGRVWRSWASGDRVPYRPTQRWVINESLKRGWLTPTDRQLMDLLALPDEQIYSLPGATVLIDDVPDQPDCFDLTCIARETAAALLSDAVSGIALRRQQAKRPTRLRPTAAGRERVLNALLQKNYEEKRVLVERWRFAVSKVEELVTKYGRDIVEVALVVAYRKRGYR